MYKIIFLVFALSTVCKGFAQAVQKPVVTASKPVAQEWLSHTDDEEDITVKYPSNWELKTSNEKATFILTSPDENDNDQFKENINVIVRELPNGGVGVKMKDIVDAVESKIPTAVDNFVLNYSKTIKWLGVDAREVSYSGNSKSGGMAVAFIQRIAISKGRLVLATYTYAGGKADVYKATALQVINSITCN
jgi:hypothetical protein